MNLRKHQRDDHDVNLTPLIDVVFLLLIFFMVSTTFERSRELGIELPESVEGDVPKQEQALVDVAVDANGRFYVDGQRLSESSRSELLDALRKALAAKPEAPVHISADANASYQNFIVIMDVARELGIARLRLPTHDESGDEALAAEGQRESELRDNK